MLLLQIRGITKSFGDKDVLLGADMDIAQGSRLALVGINGAGKSTLTHIITGSLSPDTGRLDWLRPTISVGYLDQTHNFSLGTLEAEAGREGRFLETASFLGLDRVARWDWEGERALSGGEKTKLALARIWAAAPDLLILDEPTNHMDFQGVKWLAGEIGKYPGTVLIISHDRWFLDQTVSGVWELSQGKTREFKGNYTSYRREKERLFREQLEQYILQEKSKAKLNEDIQQLTQWSQKAHRESTQGNQQLMGAKEYNRKKAKKRDKQVKSRLKMLEKIQLQGIDKPKEEQYLSFFFNDAAKRGRRVLEVSGLAKAYGRVKLFKDSSFALRHGERVAVLGANGCGKTTLLRILQGEEHPDSGQVWMSPSARVGYLSQDVTDMNPELTADQWLGFATKTEKSRARTVLAAMGFTPGMTARPLGTLSPGERTRLKLARLILQDNDCLILDEPTNHLDLQSREQLEQTLEQYSGTIILVSHDRYMLERLCDRLLVFEQKKITLVPWGFKQWQEQREERKQRPGIKERREQILLIETRMAWLLGQINRFTPEDPEYAPLDQEYLKLAQKKRELF